MARNWTLSEYATRTNWMMEQIRQNALNATIEKFKVETRRYYSGETEGSSREAEKLVLDLYNLGMSVDEVYDLEAEVKESVYCKEERA